MPKYSTQLNGIFQRCKENDRIVIKDIVGITNAEPIIQMFDSVGETEQALQ